MPMKENIIYTYKTLDGLCKMLGISVCVTSNDMLGVKTKCDQVMQVLNAKA